MVELAPSDRHRDENREARDAARHARSAAHDAARLHASVLVVAAGESAWGNPAPRAHGELGPRGRAGMIEFLQMDGYAAYVWPSYAITLAIVILNIIWARRLLSRARDEARLRIAMKQERP